MCSFCRFGGYGLPFLSKFCLITLRYGKDFKSLGRHQWRCKSRITTMENSNNNERGSSSTMERDTESTVGSDNAVEETHKCYCGRIFKSYRSLNLHRRSCFVQDSAAFGELFAQHGTNSNIIHSTENLTEASPPPSEKYELLPGVRLPRSNIAWKEANDYFQLQLSTTTEVGDLNSELIYMNNIIWTYFKDTCGLAKSGCNFDHYKTMSKSKLKKYLKDLKLNGGKSEGNQIC